MEPVERAVGKNVHAGGWSTVKAVFREQRDLCTCEPIAALENFTRPVQD